MWFVLSTKYRFVVKEKDMGQIIVDSTGKRGQRGKNAPFRSKWSQNIRLVDIIQIRKSLRYVEYFVAMVIRRENQCLSALIGIDRLCCVTIVTKLFHILSKLQRILRISKILRLRLRNSA